MIRVHYLQQVDFEGPGLIADYCARHSLPVTKTCLFAGDAFPDQSAFDLLVILGGPMNIYEETQYPWLRAEKEFIRQSIDAGKKVLGICLGAQLLSVVLGGTVDKNRHKEIGWHTIRLTSDGLKSPVLHDFPETFLVFQCHGDTFSIPACCKLLGRAEGCEHQIISFDKKVIGLQFHLEYSAQSIREWIAASPGEFKPGPFVQQPAQIEESMAMVNQTEQLLGQLLDNLINI